MSASPGSDTSSPVAASPRLERLIEARAVFTGATKRLELQSRSGAWRSLVLLVPLALAAIYVGYSAKVQWTDGIGNRYWGDQAAKVLPICLWLTMNWLHRGDARTAWQRELYEGRSKLGTFLGHVGLSFVANLGVAFALSLVFLIRAHVATDPGLLVDALQTLWANLFIVASYTLYFGFFQTLPRFRTLGLWFDYLLGSALSWPLPHFAAESLLGSRTRHGTLLGALSVAVFWGALLALRIRQMQGQMAVLRSQVAARAEWQRAADAHAAETQAALQRLAQLENVGQDDGTGRPDNQLAH
jgi:hypothetical protein